MSPLSDLIGEKVNCKDGSKKPVAELGGPGKVVGLYFSAHWCPPCRTFTPKLADYYLGIKSSPKGNDFEIIFISSDRDVENYQRYYDEMPWLSMDFDDTDGKESVSARFNVKGIPTLIFLDGDGKVICMDGRPMVIDDPEGKNFPWK